MKLNKNINIAVIGLGYVGLPLAILFSKKYKVMGFDIDSSRINDLNKNNDKTNEISSNELKNALANNLDLTFEIKNIANCNIYIITVPTPITKSKTPDLSFLEIASEQVGKILNKKISSSMKVLYILAVLRNSVSQFLKVIAPLRLIKIFSLDIPQKELIQVIK